MAGISTHQEKDRQPAQRQAAPAALSAAHAQEGSLSAAAASSQSAAPEAVQALQQQAGNQAVLDWIKRPAPGQPLDANFSGAVGAARGSGLALPGRLREQLEGNLRADFGGVRLHIDDQADQLNQQIGAKAFTVGSDIFFQRGAYSPHTAEGKRTLRHELSHVVQQKGKFSPHLRLGPENDAHEQEARRISRGEGQPQAGAAPAGGVQALFDRFRKPKPAARSIPDAETLSYLGTDRLTALGGGTANEVYSTAHPGRAGGFFKPQFGEYDRNDESKKFSDNQQMAEKSVFSSRIDKLLGTNSLANERYASYGDLQGGESEGVAGRTQYENSMAVSDEELAAMRASHDPAFTEYISPNAISEKDGQTHTGYLAANDIDYSNPTTQRSLSNLQVNDAIMGQEDRHGRNVKVDDQGHARGYDNDLIATQKNYVSRLGNLHKSGLGKIFGGKARRQARLDAFNLVNKQQGIKEVGLPKFMDINTAQSLAGLKKKDMMKAASAGGSLRNLDPKIKKEVEERYEVVRRFAKAGLGQAGLGKKKWASKKFQSNVGFAPTIVGAENGQQWGQQTYNEQIKDVGNKGAWANYSSYVERGAHDQVKTQQFRGKIDEALQNYRARINDLSDYE